MAVSLTGSQNLSRRALLGGAAVGLGAATAPYLDAGAHAAAVNPWSTRTVAVIGADQLSQLGSPLIKQALVALGYTAADVYYDSVPGRVLGATDRNGSTINQTLAKARVAIGGDPDVWVVHLWSADSEAAIRNQMRNALAAMGPDSPERKIIWLGAVRPGPLLASQVRFNTLAASILKGRARSYFIDLQTQLPSSVWTGTALTAAGVSRLAALLGKQVGRSTVGADGGWTKARLLDHPARPSGPIRDALSGRVWQTVRYEDLYRSGDSFTAVLGRVSGGKVLTLPPGVFQFSGFKQGWQDGLRLGSGGATGCVGIAGSGRNTILEMRPNTGTAPSDVAPRLVAVDLLGKGAAYFGNFQLRGTDQAPDAWSGLSIHNAHGSVVEWIYFNGASKGYMNSPPGETMTIQINQSDGVVVRDCEIDARHPVTRLRWGTSPIGWNGSWGKYAQNARVERVYAHHAKAGMITFWLTNNVHTENLHSFSCGSGTGSLSASQINFEEVTGRVRVNYPRLYSHGKWYLLEQWGVDPTATSNNGFAFGQACTTTSASDLVCLEPRFDLNVNGLFTSVAYRSYRSSKGATQRIVTPPRIVKNGINLVGHDHMTRGWQASATPSRDFTWVR